MATNLTIPVHILKHILFYFKIKTRIVEFAAISTSFHQFNLQNIHISNKSSVEKRCRHSLRVSFHMGIAYTCFLNKNCEIMHRVYS